MANNTKKSLNISFTNGEEMRICRGCADKRGADFSSIKQVVYMTETNEILQGVKDGYCYYCAVRLVDKWKDIVEKNYFEDLKAW